MRLIEKLFLSNLTYALLVEEFTAIDDEKQEEMRKNKLSFLDWLVEESSKHLSELQKNIFCESLNKVIKEKLELVINAIGPLKLCEISSKVLRSNDFVSENFLRKLTKSKQELEITTNQEVEYLNIVSETSSLVNETNNKVDTSTLSVNKKNNYPKKAEKDSSEKIENLDLTKCTDVSNCCAESNSKLQLSASSSTYKFDNAKAEQLRYLYLSQPDVIAALHPSVTLNGLFKAYPFWKTFCSHSTNSFIAWLMEMARYMYSRKNEKIFTEFEVYAKALKRIIAREAYNYVTAKSKTVNELTILLSKAMINFVDTDFVLRAIQDNSNILKTNETESNPIQVYSASYIKPDSGTEADCTRTSTSLSVSSVVSPSKFFSKKSQALNKPTTEKYPSAEIDFTNDNELDYSLQGISIPVDVRAKIVPLLTVNVTLEAIVCTLKKIANDKEQFFLEMSKCFESFIDFLINFAKKFKPSLPIEKYINHLSEIVLKTVAMKITSRKKPTSFDEVISLIVNDNSIKFNVVSKSFLQNVFESEPTDYILKDESVSLITKNNLEILSASSSAKINNPKYKKRQATSMTKKELMSLPELNTFFTSKFGFCDFLKTFKCLSIPAKELLKKLSCSFYSLLLEICCTKRLDNEQFFNYLQKMISSEIAKLFDLIGSESMTMLDVQLKLGCGDCSLVHGLEICHALENAFPKKFVVQDSRIYSLELKKKACLAPSSPHQCIPRLCFEDEVNDFVRHVNAILLQTDSGKEKLGKIFYGLNHLPESIRDHIDRRQWSFYRFLVESAVEKTQLDKVLQNEIFKYLYCDTMFCEEIMSGFFQFTPNFIDKDEFLDFLQAYKEAFVVVGHFKVGNIVAAVRQVGLSGNILFHSKLEEDTFILCKKVFPRRNDVVFSELFETMWKSKKFSFEQRQFLFGIKSIPGAPVFHHLYFRRYLIMHPSEFSIINELVHIKSLQKVAEVVKVPSKSLKSKVAEINRVTSPIEEGELPHGFDNHSICNPPKRLKISKSHEKSKVKMEKRKHKKKRKKSKDHLLKEQKHDCNQHDTKQYIDSLPNHLIQDVVIGRLMTSSDHTMKVFDILEILKTNLLRDKQKDVDNNESIRKDFQLKVLNVLKQSSKLQMTTTKNCSDPVNEMVKLQVEASEATNPFLQHPLIVFRWINRLTGISMNKLSVYIKKILKVNRTALSLSIVFAMISQKYESKKTVATTPSTIFYCQAVACMMSDPELFLNIARKTCSLASWISEGDKKESFEKIFEKVSEHNIITYMSEYLQSEKCQNGLTVEELTEKVVFKFNNDLHLSVGCIRILVQGLVGNNHNFGFTPLGKVVYQKKISASSSNDSAASSSEDELKIDVSDDDCVVSPDSTNKEMTDTKELLHNDMLDNVIRFPQEIAAAEGPSSADTILTADENITSVSSLPCKSIPNPSTDPRIKKKFFQSKAGSTESETIKEMEFGQKQSLNSSSESLKKLKHIHRLRLIEDFAVEFFLSRGYSYETQAFINSAYQRFKRERFANSMLAFEAYVRDFIATSKDNLFSFANANGDVGVSFTFYRPVRADTTCRLETKVPYIELLPEIVPRVYQFLNSNPEKKASLYCVCDYVATCFLKTFSQSHPDEVKHVSRNLVLLACIRNLKWFYFARSEPYIYVRQGDEIKPPKAPAYYELSKQTFSVGVSKDSCFSTKDSNSSHKTLPRSSSSRSAAASNTVSALEKMAELLRTQGPCKKPVLRELWLASSDTNQRKVFGTGVSFSLSLRRFETFFPTVDGLVHLNEDAFSKFLKENYEQL